MPDSPTRSWPIPPYPSSCWMPVWPKTRQFSQQKTFIHFIFWSINELKWLTKSSNHRIIQVGRDLWRLHGPTPCLKQGQLWSCVRFLRAYGSTKAVGQRDVAFLSYSKLLILLSKRASLGFLKIWLLLVAHHRVKTVVQGRKRWGCPWQMLTVGLAPSPAE